MTATHTHLERLWHDLTEIETWCGDRIHWPRGAKPDPNPPGGRPCPRCLDARRRAIMLPSLTPRQDSRTDPTDRISAESIVDVLRQANQPLTPQEVLQRGRWRASHGTLSQIGYLLGRMHGDGILERRGGAARRPRYSPLFRGTESPPASG